MSKSLFEFGNEPINEENKTNENQFNSQKFFKDSAFTNIDTQSTSAFSSDTFQGVDENFKQQAQNMYDKYKDYSQQEIVNEFLSSSKQKLRSGELNSEKLQQMAGMLSPYLNDEQKRMMHDLLGRLND